MTHSLTRGIGLDHPYAKWPLIYIHCRSVRSHFYWVAEQYNLAKRFNVPLHVYAIDDCKPYKAWTATNASFWVSRNKEMGHVFTDPVMEHITEHMNKVNA